MKHKKKVHGNLVSFCKNFAHGKCDFDENFCWFKHTADGMDTDSEEQIFQNAQEKTPPDQSSIMMEMINKLSIQL